jgi:hypothetical protein
MTTPDTTDAMFPGWLGDFVQASSACTEAHAACVGIHVLVGLGNAVGRGPHFLVGETRHGLNEFALVVGPTSIGRKGDGKNLALAPLESADPLWQVASGLSSGEGLIHHVRDAVEGVDKKTGAPVLLDPGVADKRLQVVETEFSSPLKMFRREGNILSNALRDAWDGKRVLRTLTKTSPVRATDAHISLLAHSTVEDLRVHLADLDIANGVANRFLMVAVQRARLVPSPSPVPAPVMSALVARVRAVITHALGVGQLTRTPAAEGLWREVYPTITCERHGLAGALLARGAGHVTRLAALFALMAERKVVDEPDLRSALAWWTYCVQSVEIIFAGRTGNHDADRIKAELLPGEVMATDAVRREIFANHITAARLKDALELLMALSVVRLRKEATGGRPRILVERLDGAAA